MTRRIRRWPVLAVAVVVAAGCGQDQEHPASTADPSRSSPFRVDVVPPGYEPVIAGSGTDQQYWAQDEGGSQEPYTVLTRDGSADASQIVVVGAYGYRVQDSEHDQFPSGLPGAEPIEVDGAQAELVPPSEHHPSTSVRVRRGDDLAIQVRAVEATRDELIAVARAVEPSEDRTRAPVIEEPPAGLRVLGSVHADGVVAAETHMRPNTDEVPGPPSAHASGWVRGPEGLYGRDTLFVATLPAASLDLEALVVHEVTWSFPGDGLGELGDVDGRPAAFFDIDWDRGDGYGRRTVWMESDWGDVVLVAATGWELPSREELVETARSVRSVDGDAWEAWMVEAAGGPGVRPDAGRIELLRGRHGDLEWLLQTRPYEGIEGSFTPPAVQADPCLKLSNHQRACASAGGGSAWDWISHTRAEDDGGLGGAVVVSTSFEATHVRITTASDVGEGPMVLVPGGDTWAGVVFVDGAGMEVCTTPPLAGSPSTGSVSTMRVELLRDGEVLGCLGTGGLEPPLRTG